MDVPKLAPRKRCTGCSACANSCAKECITLRADEFGFLYPCVDTDNCVGCGRCESACPIVSPLPNPNNISKAYAAYTSDKLIRSESSSGGIFSELAKSVIDVGGVVFGAAYADDFSVYHIAVENESELYKLRGAKYAQSDLAKTFPEVKRTLLSDRSVLFAGTPCQVAGLKSYLGREYDKLYCVDFICHGVPSPKAWTEFVRYRAKSDNDGVLPKSVNLRSKESGWSFYSYSNVFEYENGKRYAVKSSDSLFMKLFVGDYILNSSCDNCNFKGFDRVSDITLADFWGIWNIDKSMDDNKGTSLVVTHSEKGESLFASLPNVVSVPKTPVESYRENPSMLRSVSHKLNRKKVLSAVCKGDFEKAERILVADKGLFKKVLRKVRQKLSR